MEFLSRGSADDELADNDLTRLIEQFVRQLGVTKRVLLVPPDHTRCHSYAGELTTMLYRQLADSAHVEILPALGTHSPMTARQIETMFPNVPASAFRTHHWRTDVVRLGEVPGEFVATLTEGRLHYSIACEVNRLLVDGNWDRIISIGQVVPHEVVGMANHSKNIFVGTGGSDTIHKTHYVGAVCGMEKVMGRERSPVRDILNYMSTHLGTGLPIVYLLTVRGRNATGELVTRGLFAGDDEQCFLRAAALSQTVNLDLLDNPLRKVLVYLSPTEFKSTWLGNKAIYRTRMAIADDGELIILAPGVREFGEDAAIDKLIRRFGYRGTSATLQSVAANDELAENLAAAAHLIHGSSEGRFRVTYCPGGLSREAIESVGYDYAELHAIHEQYSTHKLREGRNELAGGEEVFFVSNPALGLWGLKSQFQQTVVPSI